MIPVANTQLLVLHLNSVSILKKTRLTFLLILSRMSMTVILRTMSATALHQKPIN